MSDVVLAWFCLEWGADKRHMFQLMPLPSIISCFIKIQNGLPFSCWLTQVVLEKRLLNRSNSTVPQPYTNCTIRQTMFRYSMFFLTYRAIDFADGSFHLVFSWAAVHVTGDHVRHWLYTQSIREKLCKKTVKHVNWTGRRLWIVVDGGSW